MLFIKILFNFFHSISQLSAKSLRLLLSFPGYLHHLIGDLIFWFKYFQSTFEVYVAQSNIISHPSRCFGQLFSKRKGSVGHTCDRYPNESQDFKKSHFGQGEQLYYVIKNGIANIACFKNVVKFHNIQNEFHLATSLAQGQNKQDACTYDASIMIPGFFLICSSISCLENVKNQSKFKVYLPLRLLWMAQLLPDCSVVWKSLETWISPLTGWYESKASLILIIYCCFKP